MNAALQLPSPALGGGAGEGLPKEGVVYIYALKCPDTLQVRYVGKAKAPKQRLRLHLTPSQLKPHTHKTHWLKSLIAERKKPLLEILEDTTEAYWQEREKFYISYYRQFCNLTNSTDGGDGVPGFKQSLEVIANRVAKVTGQKRTSETRANLSAIQKARYKERGHLGGSAYAPKCIHRFALDGTYIDSFSSLSKMCEQLGWSLMVVEPVVNGRKWKKTHHNFQFRYAEQDENGQEKTPYCSAFIRPQRKPRPAMNKDVKGRKGRAVERLTLAGEVIDAFPSVLELCRQLDFFCVYVYRVLHGQRKSMKGYRFRYVD